MVAERAIQASPSTRVCLVDRNSPCIPKLEKWQMWTFLEPLHRKSLASIYRNYRYHMSITSGYHAQVTAILKTYVDHPNMDEDDRATIKEHLPLMEEIDRICLEETSKFEIRRQGDVKFVDSLKKAK